MNKQLLNLTEQNISSLYSVSELMRSRGYWTADRSIEEDTANSIYQLFQLLAWSDRGLHDNECNMLDAAIEVDKAHGNHLQKLVESGPQELESKPRIPGCLAAAALHDSVHETRFVNLVMNSLENIAHLILMADAKVSDPEVDAYRTYFTALRRSFSALPMVGHSEVTHRAP